MNITHASFVTVPVTGQDAALRIWTRTLGFEATAARQLPPGNNSADWTLTWSPEPGARSPEPGARSPEPEGRGTRLFLVCEGFDPDDPVQLTARRFMGRGRRSSVPQRPVRVLASL